MNQKKIATSTGGMRNRMPRIVCKEPLAIMAFLLLMPATGLARDRSTLTAPSKPEQAEVLFNPHRRCILSAEVSSSVTAIPLHEGNRFKTGQVLVQLNRAIYAAALEKTQARMQASQKDLELLNNDVAAANVEKAEARLKSATIHKQTKESLFKDKTVSLSEVEDARAAQRVARADLVIAKAQQDARKKEIAKAQAILAMAKADLVAAREQVAGCTIKAPFSGRVVKRFVNAHERVQANQKLIEILDDNILEAQFFVPSNMLRQVRIGARITITVRETADTIQGTITRVGALVNPVTSTITVYAKVINPENLDYRLRGGMRGSLDLGQLTKTGSNRTAAKRDKPEAK